MSDNKRNINRKNKGGLSCDSGGLSSLEREERQIWYHTSRPNYQYCSYDDTARFHCSLTKGG